MNRPEPGEVMVNIDIVSIIKQVYKIIVNNIYITSSKMQ